MYSESIRVIISVRTFRQVDRTVSNMYIPSEKVLFCDEKEKEREKEKEKEREKEREGERKNTIDMSTHGMAKQHGKTRANASYRIVLRRGRMY